jgi:magnesium transporter
MISRNTYKKLTWIDIQSPTKDEVRSLMKEFDIHPVVAQELLSPTMRPRVDLYDNAIYLILHFPMIEHKHGNEKIQEVDFIIGKNFLITTHYDMIDPLHEFSKVFEVNSIIDKGNMGEHAGFLFFYLIKELYRSLSDELDHIDNKLESIESQIFGGNEKAMVKEISKINRDLLNFRQSVRMHKDILSSLEIAGEKFFGNKFTYYLRAITGEYSKIANQMEGHRETMYELRKTNDSLLTTKQNEVMKILTILAFITFPLSLIASIFGMNTISTPIVGNTGDFWLVIGIMIVGTMLMFAYFKHKKWF